MTSDDPDESFDGNPDPFSISTSIAEEVDGHAQRCRHRSVYEGSVVMVIRGAVPTSLLTI
jgi:hypothetical protein